MTQSPTTQRQRSSASLCSAVQRFREASLLLIAPLLSIVVCLSLFLSYFCDSHSFTVTSSISTPRILSQQFNSIHIILNHIISLHIAVHFRLFQSRHYAPISSLEVIPIAIIKHRMLKLYNMLCRLFEWLNASQPQPQPEHLSSQLKSSQVRRSENPMCLISSEKMRTRMVN